MRTIPPGYAMRRHLALSFVGVLICPFLPGNIKTLPKEPGDDRRGPVLRPRRLLFPGCDGGRRYRGRMAKSRPQRSVYEVPLYTLGEAAQIVGAGRSTVHRWARGYTYRTPGGIAVEAVPLITTTGIGRRPVVPFVGLAETYVLNAFRQAGVPMQRIRPALARLADELGIAAALASERLKSDGTEILFEYGTEDPGSGLSDLVVVRNGQRVFTEVVDRYLRTITYDAGWVRRIRLPQFPVDVQVDPDINWGQPSLVSIGVRVEDVLSRIRAGENYQAVARDFNLPRLEVKRLLASAA